MTSNEAFTLPPLTVVGVDHLSRLDFTGKDAQRFLQTKLACDTRRWRRDGGGFGFATDINGKVLFDGHFALLDGGRIRMYSETQFSEAAREHLGRYIIIDDVVMTSPAQTRLVLVSASSRAVLFAAIGLEELEEPYKVQTVEGVNVVPLERAIRPSVLVEGDSSAVDALCARLGQQGAQTLTCDEWRNAEIMEGFVRTGPDLQVGSSIPLEADLEQGVHFNKGCYLGQETIERLRSRGNAARGFRRAIAQGPVAAGQKIVDESGQEVGSVTSSASSNGVSFLIVQLRRKALEGDSKLFIGEQSGLELSSLRPVK